MSSGAGVKGKGGGGGGVCVFSEHVSVHMCVLRARVDTDTAAPLSTSICSQDV